MMNCELKALSHLCMWIRRLVLLLGRGWPVVNYELRRHDGE